ncbi:MAG: RES family NAD+ phosphorylase [Rhodobacterales bacterium]|uniref:RES family NAD+ phosphorylase n=1 Tax=Puniceibacterium antarcticum TaxID=1206336 RepID=UPI000C187115|nr:RES family NAD+ phosphorylase [Puniceibacterium antarcticum]
MRPLEPIDLAVWRILPAKLLATPAQPAMAPEGRFHHSCQIAAYASLSPEGAGVAIQRYLSDTVGRIMVPMWLEADCVADERGNKDASVVWQDIRATGQLSPTWAISDFARGAGAKAMLYSSRSRPDLSHVVVFDPSCLRFVGPVRSFES